MKILIAICSIFLAQAALGETIQVRSGEHPTFSRLVFEFGALPEWSVSRTETGYVLVTNDSRSFNVGSVYDKIPQTRLRGIKETDDSASLEFNVTCACHVEAFELSDRLLVVDIHDGPPPEGSSFEEPFLTRVEYVQARKEDFPAFDALPEPSDVADIILPKIYLPPHRLAPMVVLPGVAATAPLGVAAFETGGFADAFLRAPNDQNGAYERLATNALLEPDFQVVLERQSMQRATIDETLEAFGRAAAQGLVDALPIEKVEPPDQNAEAFVGPLADFGANIAVSTAIDRANAGFVPSVSGLRGGVCLSGDIIDVGSWGDLDQPYLDLSRARSALVGEFDVTDLDAVRRLSRLYINMGFGAEARAVLEAFPSNDPETKLLLTLAELIDATEISEPGPLAGQLECETNAALWAALAQPFSAQEIARTRAKILSTFSALPVHLRRHLGPALMERLTTAGDPDAAATVLNAIRRDGFQGDTLLAMAVAALSTERGDPMLPPSPDAVAGDTKLLAETVLRRISAGEDTGTLPNDEDMALLPILAFELRGSESARDLRIAEVNGYRRRGEIPPALAALEHARATNAIDRETAESLFRAVALAAADSMTDASLLVFATTADERLGVGPVSVEARRALADRLIALGFANTAEQMVDDIPGGVLENKLRLARIELARDDASKALRVLEGLSGQEVAELRAQAYSALASHREAAAVWEGIGRTKSALIARQRAGDWSGLETDVDELSAAATAIRQAQDVPLAQLNLETVDGRVFRDAADAVVQASVERRNAMRALLEASASP